MAPAEHWVSTLQYSRGIQPNNGFPVVPGWQAHKAIWFSDTHWAFWPQVFGSEQGSIHLLSIQDLVWMHSWFSAHSILTHDFLGSPLVFAGQRQVALWSTTLHKAFLPQVLASWHGFLHLASRQIAESGQSASLKHSFGFLQPPLTGSPISPSGQEHIKFPGVFSQLKLIFKKSV